MIEAQRLTLDLKPGGSGRDPFGGVRGTHPMGGKGKKISSKNRVKNIFASAPDTKGPGARGGCSAFPSPPPPPHTEGGGVTDPQKKPEGIGLQLPSTSDLHKMYVS